MWVKKKLLQTFTLGASIWMFGQSIFVIISTDYSPLARLTILKALLKRVLWANDDESAKQTK